MRSTVFGAAKREHVLWKSYFFLLLGASLEIENVKCFICCKKNIIKSKKINVPLENPKLN